MIEYKDTIDSFYDLKEKCWSGAIYTLNEIERHNKEDELMSLLQEYEWESMTQINDYLWFDTEQIYEYLEIKEDENDDEDYY